MIEKAEFPWEALETLRRAYAASLGGRLDRLKASAASVAAGGRQANVAELLAPLNSEAHKLAGTAGTYGFSALGTAARDLELFCTKLTRNNCSPSAGDIQEIQHLVEALLKHRPPSPSGKEEGKLLPRAGSSNDPSVPRSRRILVVEDDREQANRLRIGLSAFDYQVAVAERFDQIRELVKSFQPSVILLDLELNGSRTSAAAEIQSIRSSLGIDCPIVMLTVHDDFNARLTAADIGCAAFLVKPIGLLSLVQTLETLTDSTAKTPERVLLIDDDPDFCAFVRAALEVVGIAVDIAYDPSESLERIKAFSPDLILVDFHMPVCDGKKLSKIIRQIPQYMATPIVFLSANAGEDLRLDAMDTGIDDFLFKPISPQFLVGAVRSRVERFRALQNLMRRDSLTGLYNHASTWELLRGELARTSRSGKPISFGLIDIDHFKAVNDTSGHAAGDAVLKALSKLLTHHLRKSDIIGRLGGEEFGVLLPNTPASLAHSILDRIRLAFGEIARQTVDCGKPITLSAGIAAWPEYGSAEDLVSAADQALYQAKAAGRNTLTLAPRSAKTAAAAPSSAEEADAGKRAPASPGTPPLRPETSSEAGTAERRKRAIVLDDDPSVGDLVRPFAESAGFDVETVGDPTLFAAAYGAGVDLIVLDLNMPRLDGIEILRFLGQNRSDAAIIIVSAYDQEILAGAKSLARKENLNVIDVMTKPFDLRKLATLLGRAGSGSARAPRPSAMRSAQDRPTVAELRQAIAENRLDIHCQPKIRLADRLPVGAEALVRWKHEKHGFVPPDYFVHLAEDNGLIDDLTNLVVKKACDNFKLCRLAGTLVSVSINISDRSLKDLRFPDRILELVETGGLSPSNVMLELTETSLSTDIRNVIDVLTRLWMRGFRISIDDFGTGHSSLSRLNDLPFTELKIDKSFVQDLDRDRRANKIVRNTIELAKSLSLTTVAEGVETPEQVRMLSEFGCDIAQGYFFAKPLPVDEFKSWMKDRAGSENSAAAV